MALEKGKDGEIFCRSYIDKAQNFTSFVGNFTTISNKKPGLGSEFGKGG